MTLVIQVPLAMAAVLAFSILFNAPRKEWGFCSAVGGISWLIYGLLTGGGADRFAACFVATLALTSLSRLFSYYRRTPITQFLIAGIFPLVPGAGIYYTAYYIVTSQFSQGLEKGIETFNFAGAIALGILFGLSLPARLFRWAERPAKRKK